MGDSFDEDELPPTPEPTEEGEEIPPTPPPNQDNLDDSFERDEIIVDDKDEKKEEGGSQDSFENERILSRGKTASQDSFEKEEIIGSGRESQSHDSMDDDYILSEPNSQDSFDNEEIIEEEEELEGTPPPQDETTIHNDSNLSATPPPHEESTVDEKKDLKNLRHPSDDGMHTIVPVSRNSWPSVPPKEVLEAMRKYFGHSSFRPRQWEIVREVMNGHDVLAIMATGYGKSVCYQLPSLLRGDLTIVVSPLLSLIEDQLKGLRLNKIRASCITGNTSYSEREEIENDIARKSLNFLYLTPEFIQNADTFLSKIRPYVSMVAIDEAHCVSQWGHDFRSSYRQLAKLKQLLNPVTFLAVTATATAGVATDIKKSLAMSNVREIRTDLNRRNIFLDARRATSMDFDLCSLLKDDKKGRNFGGPTIVYCQTKDMVKEACETLIRAGVRVSMYHAGLNPKARSKTHDDFLSDRISTVVATIAFGMGIDKPDVRVVIHYGAPKNIESFYQEIGRAGRDGGDSRSIVFFTETQISRNRALLSSSMASKSEQFRLHSMEMASHMEAYLTVLKCRRFAILSHFESTPSGGCGSAKAGCCDNCDRLLQGHVDENKLRVDVSEEARNILDVISRVYGGRMGAGRAIEFLRGGSKEELRTKNVGAPCKELFGKWKTRSETWWKALVTQLRMKGFILETRVPQGFGMTVSVSTKGYQWARGKEQLFIEATPVLLKKTSERGSQSTSVPGPSAGAYLDVERKELGRTRQRAWKSATELNGGCPLTALPTAELMQHRLQLQELLYEIRNSLATKMDVAPFHVASNKVIEEISSIVPSNVSSLCSISDWSDERRREFGPDFVTACVQFAQATGISLDTEIKSQSMLTDEQRTQLTLLPPTTVSTYRCHIQSGASTTDLSNIRTISESTVGKHLADCALHGLPLHMEALKIDKDLRDTVYQQICNKLGRNIARLKPIFECFPAGFVDYNRLKIILAILEYEYGVEGEGGEEKEEKRDEKKREWKNDLTSASLNAPPAFKKKKMGL